MPILCFTHRSKHVEQLKDVDKNSLLYLGDVSVNERCQRCGNVCKLISEGH